LNEFFSRPIRIADYSWDVNSTFYQKINPWKLFWENPRVIEKIKNYYMLRCKLCLKILINGNGFYYGRMIVSYLPLDVQDAFTPPRNWLPVDLIRGSHRMHIYLNPTESEGGSMELPFFYPKNALSIPDNEWDQLGNLVLYQMNPLQHANGSLDPVTITVMAWAEDVRYSIPTSSLPQMAIESKQGDEHNINVISRPATTVATIASKLKDVSILAPFAMATETGANLVGAVAKLFGYSSPAHLDFTQIIPGTRSSLAVTDAPYLGYKMTVDSKQEITLDPRTTGIGPYDELSIKSIAGRETYLTKFDWSQNTAVDSLLFNCAVDPGHVVSELVGSFFENHFTASAIATYPFDYWRGTMRFRFQIVSSNFHKGRIRVVYDPVATPVLPEFNTHYTSIHDIADEKDFTVDVGWAQTVPYRKALTTGGITMSTNVFGNTPVTVLPDTGNGVLSLYVLNSLTAPSVSDDDIQVNVFVSILTILKLHDQMGI
jgi:hypothetical protein